MKFLLFVVPTLFASLLLFLSFGWLGLCGMSDCLGSGQGSATDVFLGVSVVVVASIPFVLTSFILYQNFRGRPIGRWATIFGWFVVLIIGLLGIFQVVVDPGDALWAGLPMLVFSSFFDLSILNSPKPKTKLS